MSKLQGFYELTGEPYKDDVTGKKQVILVLPNGEGYSPNGHEGELTEEYLKEICTKISKEEYIKRTEHLYTPDGYLEKLN